MSTPNTRCHGITGSGSRCKKTTTEGKFCGQHPTDGGLVTKTGFAHLMGFSPGRVSQLLSDGTIQETADGWVDYGEAAAHVEAARDPSRPATRAGTPSGEVAANVESRAKEVSGLPEDRREWSSKEWKFFYTVQKALEKEATAAKKQLERLESEGRLLNADMVEREIEESARLFRKQILMIPDRLAGELASIEDRREVRSILDEELRECLTTITTELDVAGG